VLKKYTKILVSNFLNKFTNSIGNIYLNFAISVGKVFLFQKSLFYFFLSEKFFLKNFVDSFIKFGYCAIPVTSITAFFIGGVLSLQLHFVLMNFGVDDLIPQIVFLSLVKELGPVLLGLMFAARSGSSITAEIGSMQANNQIESLLMMSTNPFSFLFIPRILSSIFFTPLLLLIIIAIGLLGSMIVANFVFDFSMNLYFSLLYEVVKWEHLKIGLIKSIVFLSTISFISCYQGYYVKNGAIGIGKSTINSVVYSCIFVLFANLVITFFSTR
jgi:phospholipid/cholesterol/gamma-HCH transport system permease protein